MHGEPSLNTEEGRAAVSSRKRRRWPEAERRRIVEETLRPGASVARVARAHGVNANQVFAWRRRYQKGLLGAGATNQLLPVKVSEPEPAVVRPASAVIESRPDGGPAGVIQVARGKTQIRIEGAVDQQTLRIVLRSVLR
ncbi:MAG TPA: transposase [bacterium]